MDRRLGKLTVATELARITSIAVFDDHLAINALVPVFASLPESRDRLVEGLRLNALEEAAREGVHVIFPFVYMHPDDMPYADRMFAAVEKHGGAICLVQVTCSTDAQEARVVHPDRARFKGVNSVEIVRDWNARYELRTAIPGRASLCIDITDVPPADAAESIARHYGLAVSAG